MDSLTMRQTQVQVRVNSFVRSVYNWMAIGLALTGFIAYAVANARYRYQSKSVLHKGAEQNYDTKKIARAAELTGMPQS